MISAKFLGNVLRGGRQQIDAKKIKFDIFESALCMKSVSMPLMMGIHWKFSWSTQMRVEIRKYPERKET